MDIKEIAKKLATGYWKRDQWNIEYFDSVGFAEALVESYKAELLKEVGEPVLYAEFAEDGGWLGDASEYADHLEEPHALFTSDQVSATILKATGPLEEEVERLQEEGNLPVRYYQPNGKGVVYAVYGSSSIDFVEELRAQLAAAQEEIERLKDGAVCGDCDGSGWLENRVDGRYPCTCMTEAEPYQLLHDQLAKAEQRVAEACALQVATEIKFHWLDAVRVAKEIRSGEWRKFVKDAAINDATTPQ